MQLNHNRHQKPVEDRLSHKAAPGAGEGISLESQNDSPSVKGVKAARWALLGLSTANRDQQVEHKRRLCGLFLCSLPSLPCIGSAWVWAQLGTDGTEKQLENRMVSVALCSRDTATEQLRVGGTSEDTAFCGKGREPWGDSLEPCPGATWKPPAMGTLPHPWGGCFSKGLFLLQELLFYVDTNPSQCYLYCCSLPSSRGSLWAEILYPLCISALNTGIMWWIVCSPGRNDPTAPVFLTAQVLQPFDHLCPSFGPSPVCKSSRGEQSTAGRTIVQLQWKHKFMLSECNLGCCWKSSGDVWRKQEWKWKGIIKINKNQKETEMKEREEENYP